MLLQENLVLIDRLPDTGPTGPTRSADMRGRGHSGSQLATEAKVSRLKRAQTSIISRLPRSVGLTKPVLPCARAHQRRQVIKTPLWSEPRPPLSPSTQKTPSFSVKVCRKTGAVSLVRLSLLLPGCMTEAVFRDALYAYGVSASRVFTALARHWLKPVTWLPACNQNAERGIKRWF